MSARGPGPTWRVSPVWQEHFDDELAIVAKGRRQASEHTKMLAAAVGAVALIVVVGLGRLFDITVPFLFLLIIGERVFGLFWPGRWVARSESGSAVFKCGTWSSRPGGLVASTHDELRWIDDVVFVESEGIRLDAEQRTRLGQDLPLSELEDAS